ncbi:MAG: phosphoribosylanthranilate isomerase [Clostridiales bacterium]|nr:phosphoribosylanthranilate isomerase [Clostridiales bacterium]
MFTGIKVCGLRRIEDIEAVNGLRPDFAGFVFHEKSRRNIDCETAESLLSELDDGIKSVAVCVSPDGEKLERLEKLGFDIIQIHGKLPTGAMDGLKTPVWQAVNISEIKDLGVLIRHPRIVGYVVDSAAWGSGVTFGWEDKAKAGELSEAIRAAAGDKTFILAGGLNPENVAQGIELMHPDVVDVSSGVETGGYKDYNLIKDFIKNVRSVKQ